MTIRPAVIATVCGALLLVGCAVAAPSPSPTPATHTVTGTLILDSTDSTISGGVGKPDTCRGTGGFSDIENDVELLLKDGSGTTLATGHLGGAERAKPRGCAYSFTFSPAVPEVPFYTVTIGKRGGPTYSKADLEAQTWSLTLTLGDGT